MLKNALLQKSMKQIYTSLKILPRELLKTDRGLVPVFCNCCVTRSLISLTNLTSLQLNKYKL